MRVCGRLLPSHRRRRTCTEPTYGGGASLSRTTTLPASSCCRAEGPPRRAEATPATPAAPAPPCAPGDATAVMTRGLGPRSSMPSRQAPVEFSEGGRGVSMSHATLPRSPPPLTRVGRLADDEEAARAEPRQDVQEGAVHLVFAARGGDRGRDGRRRHGYGARVATVVALGAPGPRGRVRHRDDAPAHRHAHRCSGGAARSKHGSRGGSGGDGQRVTVGHGLRRGLRVGRCAL